MDSSASTSWTVIQGAAAGRPDDREQFAQRYRPLIAAFLASRWRLPQADDRVEDATQEVLVECFRSGGVIEQMARSPVRTFRGFLYGVVRNIARRNERQRGQTLEAQPSSGFALDDQAATESSTSRAFDRLWAESIIAEAASRLQQQAQQAGPEAMRRVELLQLRFGDDQPIREIARQWDMDPALVHRQYGRARREFRRALLEVLALHHPGSPARARRELKELLATFGADATDLLESPSSADAAESPSRPRETPGADDDSGAKRGP